MSDKIDEEELIIQRLSEDPSEELLEQIASSVVDQMEDSFPELTLNSRPVMEMLKKFKDNKLEEVESEDNYETKIEYIQTYLDEEISAETTDDLTSEMVEQYYNWRKYESLSREKPLGKSTLSDDMYLFREFITYLIGHRLVPERYKRAVEIPTINHNKGEGVDDKKLDPKIANAALKHLKKYRYADVEHVAMELMCESGPRKGGLIGRDVGDFDYEGGFLEFETKETTPLKNDENSEREITLYGNVPEIIQDYLNNQRPSETDEEGRKPLLTKGNGRMSPSSLQKTAYKWTRPCKIGLDCPHDKNPEDCEAAQKNNSAYKCPSSRAPHHIRTGYITDQKNGDVSSDAIDHRCDATPRVQDIYYDLPDKSEERERYEEEFRNADTDRNSGFNHS